jgi:hypothetical protein
MLALLGFALAVLGLLVLFGLVPGGLVLGIFLLVGGILLIAYDRGAFRRL